MLIDKSDNMRLSLAIAAARHAKYEPAPTPAPPRLDGRNKLIEMSLAYQRKHQPPASPEPEPEPVPHIAPPPIQIRTYPSLGLINWVIRDHFQIPEVEFVSERKTANLVYPRQLAMYLGKKLSPQSLPAIGRRLGGRDHTTVLHGIRRIEQRLAENHIKTQLDVELLTLKVEMKFADAPQPGQRYVAAYLTNTQGTGE